MVLPKKINAAASTRPKESLELRLKDVNDQPEKLYKLGLEYKRKKKL